MQRDGVIGKYAIGGAVGASFYIEPAATFDIDIFIPFEKPTGSILVSLNPLYEYLLPRGHKAKGAHFLIKGWEVQFLAAPNPLYAEALDQAVEVTVEDVKTWVMRPEYLMAIALQTGRDKDFDRLHKFLRVESPVTASASVPLRSAVAIATTPQRTSTTTVLSSGAGRIFDEAKLRDILERHGLSTKWSNFKLEHSEVQNG